MNFLSSHAARAAAFFDIDGTLLPAPSLESRFIAYLLAHDDVGIPQIAVWLARFLKQSLYRLRDALQENKSYLRGLPESLAATWQRSLAWGNIALESAYPDLCFFTEALDQMEWHAARRHKIFLVSGTLAPLARIIALQLSARFHVAIEVCATELDTHDGVWTGNLAGPHVSGTQKALAVETLAAQHGLSLADSYAYADTFSDRAILETIGHPVAVNPSRRLARHATQRGWPMVHWHSTNPACHRVLSAPIHFEEA